MGYLTIKMSPLIRQMSIEELLFGDNIKPIFINKGETNTRTFEVSEIPDKYLVGVNIQGMIRELKIFNEKYKYLHNVEDRHSLYSEFYIPKKSKNGKSKFRKIDKPDDDLKRALRELKDMFIVDFNALYHTSAFAYVTGRSTIDCLKKHQSNQSKWYGKFDLSNFFGSTTLEFTMRMLSQIFPFSEIMSWEDGKIELEKAVSLGFLDGGLPQGTPLSPALTNIVMIPIDYEFNKEMRKFDQKFVCTRYADDFLVTSRYGFDINEVSNVLNSVFKRFDAPYVLNTEKTRYGSTAGQNWNLGLMINANNEITVGHKRKREFKASLTNYILDTLNGNIWDIHDVQVLDGLRTYYESVEPETIKGIIDKINSKFKVDVKAMLYQQLVGGVRNV